jgi:hypothetical protein
VAIRKSETASAAMDLRGIIVHINGYGRYSSHHYLKIPIVNGGRLFIQENEVLRG